MKGSYLHHKEVKAAQGIKIAAQNLENSVAGTQMLVAGPDDDIEELKEEVMQDIEDIFSSVDRSGARASRRRHFGRRCVVGWLLCELATAARRKALQGGEGERGRAAGFLSVWGPAHGADLRWV